MVELILCCGLPASGKSTWAQKRTEVDGYVWLSSDNIRANHDWNISNADVFTEMYKETIANLKAGNNVIYDATNLSAKRRKNLIDNVKRCNIKEIVMFTCEVFVAPISVLFERNGARVNETCVPDEVIHRMMTQFQFPQYFEGWDHININSNSIGEDMHVYGLSGFDQKNPHHSLSLYDHLRVGAEYARKLGFGDLMATAMWYHDVGKLDTQTFDDQGIAHYYGHENVSAYKFALYQFQNKLYTKSEFLEIEFLINYHMRPHQWTQKAYEKDEQLFGTYYAHQLKLMHKCDLMAH